MVAESVGQLPSELDRSRYKEENASPHFHLIPSRKHSQRAPLAERFWAQRSGLMIGYTELNHVDEKPAIRTSD
jgi:hypothetical protein